MNLQRKDLAKIRKLIKENYSDKYILLNRKFFDYYFRKNKKEYNIKTTKNKNQITGMLGNLPSKINYYGKQKKQTYFANLMIDKNHRGKGLGTKLIKQTKKDSNIQIVLGYGEAAKPLYKKLGWTKIGNLERYVFILSGEKISQLAETKIEKTKPNSPDIYGCQYKQIKEFNEETNKLWKQLEKRYHITTDRNAEYMNKRITENPLIKYQVYLFKRFSEPTGWTIIRIETPKNYKIARIIDFISTKETEQFALARTIEKCQEQNADLIDYYCLGKQHEKSLIKTGFKKAENWPYNQIPCLFNPISREKREYNIAYNLKNEKEFDKRIKNKKNWHITKIDGDADRPN